VDNVPLSEAIYSSSGSNVGFAVLAIGAGSVLTVRNHTSNNAINIATTLSGKATNLGASVKILHIA